MKRDWMLTAPNYSPSLEETRLFQRALAKRDSALLSRQTPKWAFLRWLTEQGYLLHGSQQADIREFEPMPAYGWPGLGRVLEPQWVCAGPALPLFAVPVTPEDFPLPVRLHDAAVVDARCAADPWGFPWLPEGN